MVFGLSIYSQTPPPNPTPTPTTVPPTPTSTPVPAACSSVSDPNCIEVSSFSGPSCSTSEHGHQTFFFLADGKCHPSVKDTGYYQLTCADNRMYGGVFCNNNDTTGFCTNCVTISSSFDANFASSGQGVALSEPGTVNPECHFNKAEKTSTQVCVLLPVASVLFA